MILQPSDPQLINEIIPDSFLGSISFKWEKETFKKVMRYLDFHKINSGAQETYKKRVNSINPCTMVAYQTGKINLNGCHSLEEMQQIVRQFMDKLGQLHHINILLTEKLTVVSFRCQIQYNLLFDIDKLSQYLFQLQSYTKNIQHRVQFVPEHTKIMIPQWIHNIKGMRLFVIRLGYIEIYKANLIPNLQQFARKIYETLLHKFSKPISHQQQIYKKNKPTHHSHRKKPVIKTVLVRNGQQIQKKQQKNEKKKKEQNEYIRFQFEQEQEQQQQEEQEIDGQQQ